MWMSGAPADEMVAHDPGARRMASVPIESRGGLALTPEREVVVTSVDGSTWHVAIGTSH